MGKCMKKGDWIEVGGNSGVRQRVIPVQNDGLIRLWNHKQ